MTLNEKIELGVINTLQIKRQTDNGFYRVGIFTTTDIDLALEMIDDYKKTNSSYWLMENK